MERNRDGREDGRREAKRAVDERSEAAAGPAVPAGAPDPELVERPRRRRFSAEYKLRVLREAEACSRPGEIGALLRREGQGRRVVVADIDVVHHAGFDFFDRRTWVAAYMLWHRKWGGDARQCRFRPGPRQRPSREGA